MDAQVRKLTRRAVQIERCFFLPFIFIYWFIDSCVVIEGFGDAALLKAADLGVGNFTRVMEKYDGSTKAMLNRRGVSEIRNKTWLDGTNIDRNKDTLNEIWRHYQERKSVKVCKQTFFEHEHHHLQPNK